MTTPDTVTAGTVYVLMAELRPRRRESDPRWAVFSHFARISDELPATVTIAVPDPNETFTDDPVPTVVTLFTVWPDEVGWTVDGGAFGNGVAFDLPTAIRDALAVVDTAGVALDRAA
ncbi:hypothetical protein [Nocardioides sp.]|uniref:hypothetical protein n=1 Tax=Nocardioides sp. TaxID=35761 RepID=UPI002B88789C|nr:hypothetical protein [Nocardioides sp.]HXH79560.1 hypothetical protein [Nocardioides sp.]